MRRRTFDMLATVGGLVLAIVLAVAGGLLLWGYSYANSNVHSQLAAQQITFPSKAVLANPPKGSTEITPAMKQYLYKYGGQQLTTGPQAKAYADHFIAVHLSEMPYHGVYAAVSQASMAQPNNQALKAEVQTVFTGTTLRGLLLEAYAFWQMGQIALVGAIVAFVGAAAMLVLSGLGFWHLRRTDPAQELFPAQAQPAAPAQAVLV
jgi:hypothetical protein